MEKIENLHKQDYCTLMPDKDKPENINLHIGDEFEAEENLSDLSEEIYESFRQSPNLDEKKKLPKKKFYNEKEHQKNEMIDHM